VRRCCSPYLPHQEGAVQIVGSLAWRGPQWSTAALPSSGMASTTPNFLVAASLVSAAPMRLILTFFCDLQRLLRRNIKASTAPAPGIRIFPSTASTPFITLLAKRFALISFVSYFGDQHGRSHRSKFPESYLPSLSLVPSRRLRTSHSPKACSTILAHSIPLWAFQNLGTSQPIISGNCVPRVPLVPIGLGPVSVPATLAF